MILKNNFWCGRQESNLHSQNFVHYTKTASAWELASLATHLSSRSVHPQPRALLITCLAFSADPALRFRVASTVFATPACFKKMLVRSPGFEPG